MNAATQKQSGQKTTGQRRFVSRSPRLKGLPGEFPNFVQYSRTGAEPAPRAAQFADVSLTGMRLISRQPVESQVGDLLRLEFTLPGSLQVFRGHARIVRMNNEFEFGVRFIDFDEGRSHHLQSALSLYRAETTYRPLRKTMRGLSTWATSHRQGVLTFATGLIVATLVGGWIWMNSDQYAGRDLKAWGKSIPKEWFFDYYRNLPDVSK